jgi:hypothetical protein
MDNEAHRALAEMVYEMVAKGGLRTTPEGLAIIVSVWNDTVGDYIDQQNNAGHSVWTIDRFRAFVLKWTAEVARTATPQAAGPSTLVSGAALADAFRATIQRAHEECDESIAAGAEPADPVGFLKAGPFCTRYLAGG